VAGKTALLMSATPGARGGIVGLNHLRTPLESLQMYVFPRMFPLGNAQDAHAADGSLAHEKTHRQFTGLLDDYIGFTRKLML
jgi:NAD(P)H-dependent FMN reductase